MNVHRVSVGEHALFGTYRRLRETLEKAKMLILSAIRENAEASRRLVVKTKLGTKT